MFYWSWDWNIAIIRWGIYLDFWRCRSGFFWFVKNEWSLISPFWRNAQQTSDNTALRYSGFFFHENHNIRNVNCPEIFCSTDIEICLPIMTCPYLPTLHKGWPCRCPDLSQNHISWQRHFYWSYKVSSLILPFLVINSWERQGVHYLLQILMCLNYCISSN